MEVSSKYFFVVKIPVDFQWILNPLEWATLKRIARSSGKKGVAERTLKYPTHILYLDEKSSNNNEQHWETCVSYETATSPDPFPPLVSPLPLLFLLSPPNFSTPLPIEMNVVFEGSKKEAKSSSSSSSNIHWLILTPRSWKVALVEDAAWMRRAASLALRASISTCCRGGDRRNCNDYR